MCGVVGGRGRNGCVGSRSPGEVLLKASDRCPYRTSYLKCIHIIQYKYVVLTLFLRYCKSVVTFHTA